jgi:hypothetical protein
MSEHQELDIPGEVAPRRRGHDTEQTAESEVDDRGLELARDPRSTPVLESQALKSWKASLVADPMWNQSDREPGCLAITCRRNESQVSGMI